MFFRKIVWFHSFSSFLLILFSYTPQVSVCFLPFFSFVRNISYKDLYNQYLKVILFSKKYLVTGSPFPRNGHVDVHIHTHVYVCVCVHVYYFTIKLKYLINFVNFILNSNHYKSFPSCMVLSVFFSER